MNTSRTTTRRVQEGLANMGVHPKDNELPLQGNQVPPRDQAPVITPPMTDEEIRSGFFTLAQAINTQALVVAFHAQSMTTKTNPEAGPRVQPKMLGEKGGKSGRICQPSSRRYECARVFLDVHQFVQVDGSCSKQIEETRLKRKNREFKRSKANEGGTSKDRLEIQDDPRFKNKVYHQLPSNFFKTNKDRVSIPKSLKARSGYSPSDKQTCFKYGKKHWGECLVGMGNFVGCGKEDHKVNYCPNVRIQEKRGCRVQ
ncbi:hypothetical protein EJD97_016964 [Solanum chilense]|uniref:Gag-pol polyprotein n=1 Tax=Solanum chilense TaxID=4083 RepID=A0A6N2B6C1_SOLCI|nr:hypothetical protein EJD97_016964 [Solanum chilense]